LETEMIAAADALEFERAAAIRDRIEQMQDAIGEPVDSIKEKVGRGGKHRRSAAKLGGKVPRPKRGV
jgi:excinuclease ABC subunit B